MKSHAGRETYRKVFKEKCVGVLLSQGRVTPHEIGWLAGIIDGEGCISARLDHGTFRCVFTVKATSERMIDECARIMDKLGVHYRRYAYESQDERHRSPWLIVVRRIADVIALLAAVVKHLRVKDREAGTVIHRLLMPGLQEMDDGELVQLIKKLKHIS